MEGWEEGVPVGVIIDKRTEKEANYNWEFDAKKMMMRIHAEDRLRIVYVPHELNRWNFYEMVLDGSWLGGYINGELKDERNDVPETEGNTKDLKIGATASNSYNIKGYIAFVAIFNKVLTEKERKKIYETTKELFE